MWLCYSQIIVFFVVKHIFGFDQNDYVLDFERVESVWYDNLTVQNLKVVTYKYNRTCPLMNATGIFTRDLGNNLRVQVQAYKFLSNEYREFPARFEVNQCHAVKKNDYGLADIYNCGNFSRCPMKKGAFLLCNWAPNPSKFPPYLPNGSYMIELTCIFFSRTIVVFNFYCSIKRPLSF